MGLTSPISIFKHWERELHVCGHKEKNLCLGCSQIVDLELSISDFVRSTLWFIIIISFRHICIPVLTCGSEKSDNILSDR